MKNVIFLREQSELNFCLHLSWAACQLPAAPFLQVGNRRVLRATAPKSTCPPKVDKLVISAEVPEGRLVSP